MDLTIFQLLSTFSFTKLYTFPFSLKFIVVDIQVCLVPFIFPQYD